MTYQETVFESHVHLCKPQYNSTGVDELLISCTNISYKSLLLFYKYDKIFASDLYGFHVRSVWFSMSGVEAE